MDDGDMDGWVGGLTSPRPQRLRLSSGAAPVWCGGSVHEDDLDGGVLSLESGQLGLAKMLSFETVVFAWIGVLGLSG
ncbi:uncharacterized protein LAJ45_10933 [Morchella importuna]|uniref:uncharacterized protein n=1 Tax=Morchella importuna TaxID=1174673 RepID=UPI001E8D89F0|nr:uncharacterized protein LAJ45_10933 [Morchella importuna]KAH8145023.1 hypothetical protein LAJ45_10933 [Morchella importuna]